MLATYSQKFILPTYLVILILLNFSCQQPKRKSLKDEFSSEFRIGVAVNDRQVTGEEEGADSLLHLHFNSLTPENGLKWSRVHPEEYRYSFEFGDAFVTKGKELDAFLVGHTLVWHQQVPDWVFQDQEGQLINAELLQKRLENHIETVVGRYKGDIHAWDVVNEAFEDDGTWRKTSWYLLMGEDYIAQAFRKANQIDPNAELYYNDYNVWKPEKRKAILEMAQALRKQGVRIDGIGMQGHYRLDFPSLDIIEQAILDIHEAGFDVMVTELDVDILPRPSDFDGADLEISFSESERWNPFKDGITPEKEEELVRCYQSLFQLFRKHSDKISRVTFWGMHDGSSWLNNWPVRGRTNFPLLFDRNKRLKPGFWEAFRSE
ncbi:endo-1,4-beta-xylanase [Algoriphagus sp. NBT04N3]|jgi:endo-1,4-beta-xylanase|uniref:endo-1,4-beta-xylanase n=1 Tax=Algoriphagus sp. NBT04N3 TaxID=2705473 RepID=UPI001C63641F|nr:endo-1,4-beta-xylanase [Algoriphagus sp. NBT04N3]QYH37520.1 endo-1,4-beta-xylanase [Algoriphagus sp. NBT04N3]